MSRPPDEIVQDAKELASRLTARLENPRPILDLLALYASEQAATQALLEALKSCDDAFAAWQCGQIPGRPEDILALVVRVRSVIADEASR